VLSETGSASVGVAVGVREGSIGSGVTTAGTGGEVTYVVGAGSAVVQAAKEKTKIIMRSERNFEVVVCIISSILKMFKNYILARDIIVV